MPDAPLPTIGDDIVITRNKGFLTGLVHDETVMMDLESGRTYGLDDIGTVIWQRLEAPCKFGELVDGLAAEFDAERAVIAADVSKLLTILAEHKVIGLA
jgi:Coenzyme PQQ synthesis protein D (PqqD)